MALELPAYPLAWPDVDRGTASSHEILSTNVVIEEAEKEKDQFPEKKASDWRRALTWRFPVLVTSLSPLRVYMHSEGVAWDGLTSYLQQKVRHSEV